MSREEEERSFYSDFAIEFVVGVLVAWAVGALVEHLKTLPDIGPAFSGILPYIAVGIISSVSTIVVCKWRSSGRIKRLKNKCSELESLLSEYEDADRETKLRRGIRRRLANSE